MLRQVDGNGVRCRLRKDVTFLGSGLGEELWHAVELRLYAVEAFGDGDRVVEDCIGGVVAVCLLRRVELVEQ